MKRTTSFNPLQYPICLEPAERLVIPNAWVEHIPFAMTLIDMLRPRKLVELGTHSGNSYCAFCQAVKKLATGTHCYAVDTWKGDPQASFYGPEILAELQEYHDSKYAAFSTLLQSTFDDAKSTFADSSIDLLHIDGLHTYEAVKHDFENWLPKLSERGVVLFHDISEKKGDFGVWKLWKELMKAFPFFEFEHGHGLGILLVGKNCPDPLQEFVRADSPEVIREFYFEIGRKLDILLSEKVLAAQLTEYDQKETILNSQLSELEKSVEALTCQIANRDQSIQTLQNQLKEQELTNISLHQEIAASTQAIQTLNTRIETAEQNNQNLLNEIILMTNRKLENHPTDAQPHEKVQKKSKLARLYYRVE